MKCYYHSNRDAVGTCQTCGKALCKECASVYTPVTCGDCHVMIVTKARNEREKAKQDALINTSGEMKKAVIIGVVAGLAISILLSMNSGNFDFVMAAFYFFVGFGLPFGWSLISHIIPNVIGRGYHATISMTIIYIVKFLLSAMFGIPAFIIQMVLLVTKYKRIQKMR